MEITFKPKSIGAVFNAEGQFTDDGFYIDNLTCLGQQVNWMLDTNLFEDINSAAYKAAIQQREDDKAEAKIFAYETRMLEVL